MKLALQNLEVSTSHRIIDSICDFELLPWCITVVAGDGLLMSGNSSDTGQPVVDIALMRLVHRLPNRLIIPRLPKALLVLVCCSDEWRVGGKSCGKIRFGSFCVRKATAEGKLKTRPCFEDFDCNSSAEGYKLHNRFGNAYMS